MTGFEEDVFWWDDVDTAVDELFAIMYIFADMDEEDIERHYV